MQTWKAPVEKNLRIGRQDEQLQMALMINKLVDKYKYPYFK